MIDVALTLAVGAVSGITAVVLALVALRGWNNWLDLKRGELAAAASPSTGQRIEVADLRERVRRLEAIAAGVEL